MPAAGKILVDACFQAREPELVEALDLAAGEVGVGEVGQRFAAPQRQRGAGVVRSELLEA